MALHLDPYDLPERVREGILKLASACDILLVGETHGTREVPAAVFRLLPDLRRIGYGGLGVEVNAHERSALSEYCTGHTDSPPAFFDRPNADGRGNEQALALLVAAAEQGYTLMAFDQGWGQSARTFAERDSWMARNLLAQRERMLNADPIRHTRTLAICGSAHASMARARVGDEELWPTCAAWLGELAPNLRVASLGVVFHAGAYYNLQIKSVRIQDPPLAAPAELRSSDWRGHSLELHLPACSPATFARPPRG